MDFEVKIDVELIVVITTINFHHLLVIIIYRKVKLTW